MAAFYLTNKAVEDLNDIWEYTIKTWSENQAEKYYLLLMNSCQDLAERPERGKSYDMIAKNVFGYKVGEHIVFLQHCFSKRNRDPKNSLRSDGLKKQNLK